MPENNNNQTTKQPNNEAMPDSQNQEHHHAKEFAIILAAVVLLAVIGFGWWYFGAGRVEVTSEEISPGVIRNSVESGSIVPAFPEELIREEGVVINGSYSFDYVSNNKSQPVVRYTSEKGFAEVIDLYLADLDENGWELLQSPEPRAPEETFLSMYKDGGQKEVNIMFIHNDDETVEVNIAYIER